MHGEVGGLAPGTDRTPVDRAGCWRCSGPTRTGRRTTSVRSAAGIERLERRDGALLRLEDPRRAHRGTRTRDRAVHPVARRAASRRGRCRGRTGWRGRSGPGRRRPSAPGRRMLSRWCPPRGPGQWLVPRASGDVVVSMIDAWKLPLYGCWAIRPLRLVDLEAADRPYKSADRPCDGGLRCSTGVVAPPPRPFPASEPVVDHAVATRTRAHVRRSTRQWVMSTNVPACGCTSVHFTTIDSRDPTARSLCHVPRTLE